jgi:valyl-tRNA synthetase
MNGENERWGLLRSIEHSQQQENLLDKIQNFMFSFQIKSKEDISKFLKQANETSLKLFKQDKSFITDYVETKEMSKKDKLKDIEMMINAFVEEERYEDCAFLVKIKNKIKKYYNKQKINSYE